MKALLVDAPNLVRRIYAAAASDESDALAHTITSATASLQRAINLHHPSHCVAVFDADGATWRHQQFPDYKKNRKPAPAPLRDATPQFERAFAAIGVTTFSLAGYEADDVIATFAVKIAEHNGDALIIATDRNYCQLLSTKIRVHDHFAQQDLDYEMIMNKFQVEPARLPDLLSLAGDTGVSIAGVPGIGIRSAAKLIRAHGDLANIIKSANDIPGKLGAKILDNKQAARLAKTLFTLKTDIKLGVNLNQFRLVTSSPPPQ